MTEVVRNRTRAERAAREAREARAPWVADKLYRRNTEYRRVMFLELLAWAICKLEGFETEQEAYAFFAELVRTREERWGDRPWPRAATDHDAYLRHVREIADVFATASSAADASYPNRNDTA
jgi:hypothetical protein